MSVDLGCVGGGGGGGGGGGLKELYQAAVASWSSCLDDQDHPWVIITRMMKTLKMGAVCVLAPNGSDTGV